MKVHAKNQLSICMSKIIYFFYYSLVYFRPFTNMALPYIAQQKDSLDREQSLKLLQMSNSKCLSEDTITELLLKILQDEDPDEQKLQNADFIFSRRTPNVNYLTLKQVIFEFTNFLFQWKFK